MNDHLTDAAAMSRRAFVAALLATIPDALIVTGLGSASYDVFAAGDRDHNYYLWGAMGGACPLGLGLALAQPERSVVVVTGDGEQLMGVGSLASIAAKRPDNLSIIVLDNGHFGETGMQRSHASLGCDLVAVARGVGFSDARTVTGLADCAGIGETITARTGTLFVRALIARDEPARVLPPRDGPFVKNRFRGALGLKPF